jgi:hypothetical protein
MVPPEDRDPNSTLGEVAGALANRGMPSGLERLSSRPDHLDYLSHPIRPTNVVRMRSLAMYENRSRQYRVASPAWVREEEIPGLLVVQLYSGGDAFGVARQTAELDLAVRRAAALIRLLDTGERVTSWPRPIRPARGGLWLLDARHGSLDALYTFYGALVSVAMSQPVSLASFASLAWTSSKSAARLASKWVVRTLHPRELVHRPSAGESSSALGTPDQEIPFEQMTRRLLPLFKQAVDDGRGLDFRAKGSSGEIRFIVTPRNDNKADSVDNAPD